MLVRAKMTVQVRASTYSGSERKPGCCASFVCAELAHLTPTELADVDGRHRADLPPLLSVSTDFFVF